MTYLVKCYPVNEINEQLHNSMNSWWDQQSILVPLKRKTMSVMVSFKEHLSIYKTLKRICRNMMKCGFYVDFMFPFEKLTVSRSAPLL